MERSKLAKKTAKYAFYGLVGVVGVLAAVSTVKKKGKDIKKGGDKALKKAKRLIRKNTGDLNERQIKILELFNKSDKITLDMIDDVIEGVSGRTIRRDLDDLEDKNFIRQVGKTKGSYYIEK